MRGSQQKLKGSETCWKGTRRQRHDFACRRLAGAIASMMVLTPDDIPDAGCGARRGSSEPASSPCSSVHTRAEPGQAGGHRREVGSWQGKGKRAPPADPPYCKPCSSGQMTLQQQPHLQASSGQGDRADGRVTLAQRSDEHSDIETSTASEGSSGGAPWTVVTSPREGSREEEVTSPPRAAETVGLESAEASAASAHKTQPAEEAGGIGTVLCPLQHFDDARLGMHLVPSGGRTSAAMCVLT